MTSTRPIRYQGLRCPMGVLNLSERTPTMGVITPSQICPDSKAAGAAAVWTTLLRK